MFAKGLLSPVLAAATAFAAPLVEDLKTRQNCADVTIFFARGTTELGPLGVIVGPGLQANLQTALGTKPLSFNGIEYPTSTPGYFAGGDAGGAWNDGQKCDVGGQILPEYQDCHVWL